MHAPAVDEDKRAPVSVTLVLDKSRSMAGSKLKLVKDTCKFLLQQLGARDSVGVVSYAAQVCSLSAPLSPCFKAMLAASSLL